MGDKVENKFDQAKGWMKEKWGWLTDDDFLEMEGKAEKIKAKVKDHYGDAKWEAEYDEFTREYPEYK
ncbi:MAG TPA: CsbD family protein [Tissierellia bacterium]|nr:CsbD family protein [Tissierellia bacterium]